MSSNIFTEEEFKKACNELDTPDVEAYEFFTESHGVKIYRLYNEESGLYSYKIYGGIEGIEPDQCAKVYMDIEYRRKWDGYVVELLEVKPGEPQTLYWQVNFPFPMSNRDYVYARQMQELDLEDGRHVWVILAQSQEVAEHPERKGVVRVKDYLQTMAITTDGKGGTKAYMRYYDNPGGSIPTWLINYAAKTGVPGFLGTMQTACKGYPEYLQKKAASG